MKRVILLLFFPLLAFADPGAATRYLMNEPASLMDIGLLRANISLDANAKDMTTFARHKTENDDLRIYASAEYKYADDLIIFELFLGSSKDSLGEECDHVISNYSKFVLSRVDPWFFHAGFLRKTQPEELETLLKERIEMRCKTGQVSARRRLLEDEIFWLKEDEE